MVSAGAALSNREKREQVVGEFAAWTEVCQVTLVQNLDPSATFSACFYWERGRGNATQSDMKSHIGESARTHEVRLLYREPTPIPFKWNASVSEGRELSVGTTDRGAISELLPELSKAIQLLHFIYTDCPECSGGFSCFKDGDGLCPMTASAPHEVWLELCLQIFEHS